VVDISGADKMKLNLPPLGFENHAPNIPLAVICIIAVAVYLAIPVAVVAGAWLLLNWVIGQ
jgi:hypothetical protein